MYVLEVANESGYKLRLTQNESNYQVIKVDGLLPPKADIVTTKIASVDGERFKSSKIEARNVVITIVLNGDIEKNRIALYEVFDNGKPCTIYYQNGSRNVFCMGYCEEIEADLFEEKQTIQISILCPEPFWKDTKNVETNISFTSGNFTFPFAIDAKGIEFSSFVANRETKVINIGEVTSGMIITVKAVGGTVENPVIYNVKTNEFFKVNVTLADTEELVINTNIGHRSIMKQGQNVFNLMERESTWLQLNRGVNTFTYNADSGVNLLEVKMTFNPMYKGV